MLKLNCTEPKCTTNMTKNTTPKIKTYMNNMETMFNQISINFWKS